MTKTRVRATIGATAVAAMVVALFVGGSALAKPQDSQRTAKARAVPAEFIGMLSYNLSPYGHTPKEWDQEFSAMHKAGVGTVRGGFDAHLPLTAVDAFVLEAAKNKIRLLPQLLDTSRYDKGQGPGHGLKPPKSFKKFGRFAAKVTGRYGPKGTIWKAHPSLRRYAVKSWQIWNEPNLKVFWQPKPNPKAYAKLVKVTAKAIHKKDKHAVIVSAGIPDSKQSKPYNYKSYLGRFLKAGGRKSVSSIGAHAYAPTVGGFKRILKAYRKTINKNGGRKLGILITEVGWADKGHKNPQVVGKKGQAARIAGAYRLAGKLRKPYKLTGIFYFEWKDYPLIKGDPRGNTWGYHTGLIKLNGKHKQPAYNAFKKAVAKLR